MQIHDTFFDLLRGYKISRAIVTIHESTSETATNFSTFSLFNLSRNAVLRVSDQPRETIVAVTFAVAGIEALINDTIEYLDGCFRIDPDQKKEFGPVCELLLEAEQSKASTIFKLNLCRTVLLGQPFDPGKTPLQAFKSLVKLRNLMVHIKPEIISRTGDDVTRASQTKNVLSDLAGRKLIKYEEDGQTTWLEHVCIPSVAAWSHDSAAHMAVALLELFSSTTHTNVIDWQIKQFKSNLLSQG